MIRTQIQLTEEQSRALRERAAEEGRSMADVIRGLVDDVVGGEPRPDREERRRRALAAIGSIGKGPRDLSRRHDRYLAEAFR
jgi:plasmid stability protein